MNSFASGKSISPVEVTNIGKLGFWLLVREKEHFLPFEQFSWFLQAKIEDILNVQLVHEDHLRWPALDVDLSLESIENPESFPLIYK
ncbi:MAG: DUF2442 domain-containing protein [Candidatus Omnitrophota bacterium]